MSRFEMVDFASFVGTTLLPSKVCPGKWNISGFLYAIAYISSQVLFTRLMSPSPSGFRKDRH